MQKNGKGKQVLLITDVAGYSKVALSAMLPVLTHLGYDLYNLPTALVSNNFAYGEYAFLDTTDYMRIRSASGSIWGSTLMRCRQVS